MMMEELLHNKKLVFYGQTLIEALVAVALAGIVIVAATAITSSSLRNTQKTKDSNLASQFAQEGLEIARKERLPAPVSATTYCVGENATSLDTPTACGATDLINYYYKREVTLNPIVASGPCGASTYPVVSDVYWTDARCSTSFCQKVEEQTCLSP